MLAKGTMENNFNLFYFFLYGESPTVLGTYTMLFHFYFTYITFLDHYRLSQLREYEYLPFTKNSGTDYAQGLKSFKVGLYYMCMGVVVT